MSVVVSMDKFTAVQTEYPVKYNFARDSGSITALIVVKTPGMMTHLRRKSFINVRDIKVMLPQEQLRVAGIRQFYMDCKNEVQKCDTLVPLHAPSKYKRTVTADRISTRMSAKGHKVAFLHGAKDPAERDAIIDNFRDGRSDNKQSDSRRRIDVQVNMYERNLGRGGMGGHFDKPDNRSNGSLRTPQYLYQLRVRLEDLAADGADREATGRKIMRIGDNETGAEVFH
ncbi:hypothetical protein B0H13DRAFT_2520562 [Mycena leptocephala]|nr:hypothetical protein B0H13DRAFT_2520562 [Mycena leptocephala]